MEVSIRVDVVNRVVKDVAVAVEILWIIWFTDKWVGRDEAAKLRVIVSAAIVVEAALWIKDVAGEAPKRIAGAFRSACLTPWVVLDNLRQ